MYCRNCGAKLPDDAAFCGACGAPCGAEGPMRGQSAAPEAPSSDTGGRPGKGASGAFVAVAVVVAALAMAAVAVAACFALGALGTEQPLPPGGGTADETQATSALGESADEADGRAAHEEAALAFATRYFDNTVFPDPADDSKTEYFGGGVEGWADAVRAYLQPGSAAARKFEDDMMSNPIQGHGAAGTVLDAEVVSSADDEVVVRVEYAMTQAFEPGWSRDKSRSHVARFTCSFADDGLIDEYALDIQAEETGGTAADGQTHGAAGGDGQSTQGWVGAYGLLEGSNYISVDVREASADSVTVQIGTYNTQSTTTDLTDWIVVPVSGGRGEYDARGTVRGGTFQGSIELGDGSLTLTPRGGSPLVLTKRSDVPDSAPFRV